MPQNIYSNRKPILRNEWKSDKDSLSVHSGFSLYCMKEGREEEGSPLLC